MGRSAHGLPSPQRDRLYSTRKNALGTMERNEFQELLFQTAFCVVASDGHIDEREIEELRSLEGSAVYFQGIDLREELDRLVTSLQQEGEAGNVDGGPIAEVLKKIKTGRLSVVQELLLLELALRI